MVVITLPFLAPLIEVLGFNFIWFGVVYVVLAKIGLITPPFGLNLFVPHSVVPQYDIMRTVWGEVLPFHDSLTSYGSATVQLISKKVEEQK